MSKQVDERVVSMQFDNKHFESNVSTTMSTLDKLKQKLKLDGASKGLESINTAAKNVNMAGLGNNVEAVRMKFSALQVMGVTTLANLTTAAVNAGTKIVKALTLDPVISGFREYETQMNAVQTILANTKSKGSTLDDVNNALDTLNTYADKTIYNFTEMTSNIGKFTAAGVDLQTSVDSIKGIANLAAVSGSSSQQASTAMYQLSQALAAGKVSLMDWNSVVNAGMGGELFQDALIRTSELLKTGAKDAIDTYGSFRESLTKGEWLTTEVLTETLKQLSGAYTEADLIAQGFTKKQAKEIIDLSKTAIAAATEVKTFTQLWDVMKESAQSGWAQTWKLLVGDFEEAKALLTPIADFFTGENGVITKISEARNNLLEAVLSFSSPWSKIADKLNAAGLGKIKETIDTVSEATKKLSYYQDVVTDVWRGDYKNSDTGRFELLKKAGYNDDVIQDLVNKGYGYKLTMKDVEESHKKFGLTMEKTSESTKKASGSFEKLSNEALKNAGLTEHEIKLYNDLAEEAERTGVSIGDLVDKMSKTDGRTLLIDSLKNAGSGLVGIFTALKDAWSDIFPAPSVVRIYNIIDAINQFSENLRLTDKKTGKLNETGEKLQRTFKGIFAIFDIVLTVVGGPLKIAFKALVQLLGMFDLNILDVTAVIGDAIVGFRDWIDTILDFTGVFEKIIPPIKNAFNAIKEWFAGIKTAKNIPQYIADGIVSGLGKIVSFIGSIFGKIWDILVSGFSGAPGDMASGFVNGVWGVIQTIGLTIWELGTRILETFRNVLGIHSPSTETRSDGRNFMLGFLEGLKSFAGFVWDFISSFAAKCIDIVRGIDFGTVLAGLLSSGITISIFKMAKAFEALTSPFEGLGSVLDGTGEILEKSAGPIKKILKNTAKVVKSFSKVMNSVAFNIRAKGIKELAIAIAILAGTVIVLTLIDPNKLWEAVKILATLAGVLALLAIVTNQMSSSSVSIGKDGAKLDGVKTSLLKIAAAMLLLGITVKILGGMDLSQAIQGVGIIVLLLTAIGGMLAIYGKFVKGDAAKNIDKAGATIMKLSTSILLLAVVAKIIAGMSWEDVVKAGVGLAGFTGIIAALMLITKLAGKDIDKVGPTIKKLSTALLLLTVTAKIIAGMSWEDLIKAEVGLIGFTGVIAALTLITKMAGKDIDKIGSVIMSMSTAMLLLTITARILAGMSWGDMLKAEIGLLGLTGVIAVLVSITKLAGKDAPKIAGTLLAMSAAIGILAAIAVILGFVDLGHLSKGIIAVGLLATMMTAMIWATRGANNCKANLIVMTVAIAIMATAIAALSFIDLDKLAAATASLSLVMGMFAVMAKGAGSLKTTTGTLILMTAIVAILAVILHSMSSLPVAQTLSAAASLSMLLLSMTSAMTILGKTGRVSKSAIGTMALMGLVVAELAAILGVMSYLNVESSIGSALAIGVLLNAMVVALTILDKIGKVSMSSIGALALMGLVVGELAIILGLMSHFNVNPSMETAKSLSLLLTTMSGALVILGVVGMMGPAAFIGIGALATLIGGVGGLLIAIGALVTYVPQVEEFLDNGIPVLEKIGKALGSFFGNIVGGFLEGISGVLPQLGSDLSEFMDNISGFVNGTKNIDDNIAGKIGSLALAIIALTGAELVAGIGSLLSLGTMSFARLGSDLSGFMNNASDFIKGANSIDPKIAQSGKALADMIMTLTGADLINGLTSWFTGGDSLTEFANQLVPFGEAMVDFSETVSGNIDKDAVTATANAGKILSEMAATIPNSGGLAGIFAGENDLDTFTEQLVPFGEAMVDFSSTVAGKIDKDAVSAATNAGKALAEMTKCIPNSGGVVSWFTGDNSIAQFGDELIDLGEGLKGFSESVSGINVDSMNTVTGAAKTLAEMTNCIPNSGGVVSWFAGDNSVAQFGDELIDLGVGLSSFAESVKDINVEEMNAATGAAKTLAEMTNYIPNSGGMVTWFTGDNSVAQFGVELVLLGKGLKGFADSVDGVDPEVIKSAAGAAKTLAEMTKHIPDSGGMVTWFTGDNSIAQFGTELIMLGKGLKGFADSVSGVNTDNLKNAASAAKTLAEMSSFTPESKIAENWPSSEKLTELGKGLKGFVEATSGVDVGNSTEVIKVGKSLAEMIKIIPDTNGILAWFGGESSVSKFKTDLTDLAEGLVGFSNIASGVDVGNSLEVVKVGKALAEMIKIIPDTNGILAWFGGESSVSKFKTDLADLGEGLVGFSTKVAGVNAEKMSAAANAGKTLAEMVNIIPDPLGISAWFGGESSVSKFKTDLISLGEGLAGFSTKVAGINAEKMGAATTAAKSLAEMINIIPNTEGIAAWFGKETSVSTFKDDLIRLGEGLSGFSIKVADIDPERISAAATAAKSLAELTKIIPSSEGIAAWFSEETGISRFANGLGDLGTGLSTFSTNASGVKAEVIETATTAAKSLAEMAKTLPSSESMAALFGKESSVTTFASGLGALGTGLSDFSTNASGVDKDTVSTATSAAKALADMSNVIPDNTGKLITFGTNLKTFGVQLSGYFISVSGVSSDVIKLSSDMILAVEKISKIDSGKIGPAAGAIDKMVDALKNMAGVRSDAASGFVSAVSELAEVSVDDFSLSFEDVIDKMSKTGSECVNAFTKAVGDKAAEFSKSGQNAMTKFASGITDSEKKVTGSVDGLVSSAASEINTRENVGKFAAAGVDLVEGFANGISSKSYLAEAKSRAMAAAAVRAAKDELDEHSPSRVFYDIGAFAGIALVNALGDYTNKAEKAGGSLARASVDGLKRAISRVTDIINSDIDTQPTIRPVLDLSNIESGASAIGGMLGGNRTLSVDTNAVGAISASMSRVQNGGNSNEIVSAIKALRKDISNLPRSTTNVNGITYDDGSNVSTAVQTLIRAAKIERRT